jgi:3',5'-cyclic AMP phosphodiesterase CpdA
MRLAWLTDLHLNFVDRPTFITLVDEVRDASPDAVLIGGDVAEAGDVCQYLKEIAERVGRPVHFVLGNHDFYHGSIAAVRAEAVELSGRSDGLTWLPSGGVVPLTSRTALIGHDGWGDGGHGNTASTPIVLNDFRLIAELREATPDLPTVLRRLGEEAADYVGDVLPAALREHDHVLLLTHVPPFAEAAWHEGGRSDDDWLPFFACRAVGDVLRAVMADHPHGELTVLCGHTHGLGECRVLPNLRVLTGGAEYGRPRLQRVIEIE